MTKTVLSSSSIVTFAVLLAATLPTGPAQAAQAAAQAAAPTLTATAAATPAATSDPAAAPDPAVAPAPAPAASAETPWIKRYRPTRGSWELGIYGGLFLPSSRHEFYQPKLDVVGYGHQPLARVGGDLGLRVGYYPLSFLGLELEGGLLPIKVADGSRALMYALRPVAVFQLPYRIAPFVRAGFGLLGISSSALGKDIDPSFNIGGGVKFYVNQAVALRLDVVDNVATAYGVGNGRSNNLELLLGVSLRLGRKPAPARQPLIDSDGDGLYDPGQPGLTPAEEDLCPRDPGLRAQQGCPLIDSDGDALYDPGQLNVPAENVDACPQQPGPRVTQGCPQQPVDSDGDGLWDPGQGMPAQETDTCPAEPGPRALQGCPDRDGDRIPDRLDKCPSAPETYNQLDDGDGCPDELPSTIKKISGTIAGIYFDVDKDTIKPRSLPILLNAVKVLGDFPETRWQISGHTDGDGSREHNLDLSKRRAAAVRQFLIDQGIDGARLTSEGFGPDMPIDSNKTKAGKARNRRIEFKLIN